MEFEHDDKDMLLKTKHEEDENKKASSDGKNGEDEMMHSEEIGNVFSQSETHSRSSPLSSPSSSSSSSSSSYLSPPKDLPEDEKESSNPETYPPHVQVMKRDSTDIYDPNRIPSSVFERKKSGVPADWSCASNDSLFSIHLGRNSFTGYGGDDIYKSGELLEYSPGLPMPPPPGSESKPLIKESDKEEEVVLVEDAQTSSSDEDKEDHKKEQNPPAVSWKSPTTSYRSNRSSNSTHSFSFPILAGAASDSKKVETEEEKKEGAKQSEEPQKPAEAANQKQPMCSWFSWVPSCPSWCSSCSRS